MGLLMLSQVGYAAGYFRERRRAPLKRDRADLPGTVNELLLTVSAKDRRIATPHVTVVQAERSPTV
jgi:hypothetical protein